MLSKMETALRDTRMSILVVSSCIFDYILKLILRWHFKYVKYIKDASRYQHSYVADSYRFKWLVYWGITPFCNTSNSHGWISVEWKRKTLHLIGLGIYEGRTHNQRRDSFRACEDIVGVMTILKTVDESEEPLMRSDCVQCYRFLLFWGSNEHIVNIPNMAAKDYVAKRNELLAQFK